jgi:hypothetical protein
VVYEDIEEILAHAHSFDWENTSHNLFHNEDTLGRLSFVDKAIVYLDDFEEDESADPNLLDMLEEIIAYRDIVQEFADSFDAHEDSPSELFQENEYVREIETELRTLSDDILRRLNEID